MVKSPNLANVHISQFKTLAVTWTRHNKHTRAHYFGLADMETITSPRPSLESKTQIIDLIKIKHQP